VLARGDRRLFARTMLALVVANVRYWSTIAPVVRVELEHWRRRARAIPDVALRERALAKLEHERFHADGGAMLATLAPRVHRRDAVEAIVALEVLYDLLDGLTEQPLEDPLGDGARLFTAFTDAVSARPQSLGQDHGDHGYLQELSLAASGALARLPARAAVIEIAAASAERAAQAQIRMHATPRLGTAQLQEWAQAQAPGTGLQWRELLAGAASSVVAIHALVAAAADARTTPAQAARIEAAYLPVCVLVTLLDSLVDEAVDKAAGEIGYISLYADRELLAQTLGETAVGAVALIRELPNAAHHLMTLTGVVAYYTSAPEARAEAARPVVSRLHSVLSPLLGPTLAFMRAWRMLRRIHTDRSSLATRIDRQG
jgi:tetraprenyl-beta-curcumene synthase